MRFLWISNPGEPMCLRGVRSYQDVGVEICSLGGQRRYDQRTGSGIRAERCLLPPLRRGGSVEFLLPDRLWKPQIGKCGSVLLSHTVTHAVPSAQEGLTAVFEMGTGVAPPLSPPQFLSASPQEWQRYVFCCIPFPLPRPPLQGKGPSG
jgi:hypothetical protein